MPAQIRFGQNDSFPRWRRHSFFRVHQSVGISDQWIFFSEYFLGCANLSEYWISEWQWKNLISSETKTFMWHLWHLWLLYMWHLWHLYLWHLWHLCLLKYKDGAKNWLLYQKANWTIERSGSKKTKQLLNIMNFLYICVIFWMKNLGC